jgi:hypothetical protein
VQLAALYLLIFLIHSPKYLLLCQVTVLTSHITVCRDAVPTRGEGRWLKLAAPKVPERGLGPENVACVVYFLCSIITCLLHKLTLSDRTRCGPLCVHVAYILVPYTVRLRVACSLVALQIEQLLVSECKKECSLSGCYLHDFATFVTQNLDANPCSVSSYIAVAIVL